MTQNEIVFNVISLRTFILLSIRFRSLLHDHRVINYILFVLVESTFGGESGAAKVKKCSLIRYGGEKEILNSSSPT